MNKLIIEKELNLDVVRNPQTKIIYNYSDRFIFCGSSILYEAGNLCGVFLLPAMATEIAPPTFNVESEIALWSEQSKEWTIKDRPGPDNTPKPEIDKNIYKAVWDFLKDEWKVEVKTEKDFLPKPEFNKYSQYLDLEDGEWIIKDVIRTQENTPKPVYSHDFQTIKWDTDKWVIEDIVSWEVIRIKRIGFLYESDWTMFPDVNLPNKQQWVEYRQALRDIPQNFVNPEDVVWPIKP